MKLGPFIFGAKEWRPFLGTLTAIFRVESELESNFQITLKGYSKKRLPSENKDSISILLFSLSFLLKLNKAIIKRF